MIPLPVTLLQPLKDKQAIGAFPVPKTHIPTSVTSAPPKFICKILKEVDFSTATVTDILKQLGRNIPKRVVCVMPGGTTVPLEQRCVRYIDKFNSGHRGAISCEYFLRFGYSVMFLYRR
ncbi:phosphopantothenate--cysteine ligase 2 [Tanacetum coccineum]